MKLENVKAVITGAGSGLGEGTARYLSERGAELLLIDLNEEGLKKVANDLGANYFVGDVSNEIEMTKAVKDFEGVNCLVNCAGIAVGAKVVSSRGMHSLNLFEKVLNVNLIGSFNMLRLCADKMQSNDPDHEGEKGVIINTASVAAYDGQIGQAAYSASKGGIVGMTLPIARELAAHGIRVNTIAPGLFSTPMLSGMSEEVQKSLIATTIFPKRLGTSLEYAMLVESILTNVLLNGETIRLDGSVRLAPR
ncbi:SDR family NAD(P)-dependent oxidoreductase [Alphaproteobacteria bacterium]|jgi:NAD(P)-dependent dehydrogenase (short-subunit alcohol dehydrogenase family)|nr:SDR family NAD(P)-dependent oxidoreductase [Alphaproteobacteria bacterium]MDA9806303.1 SDR family NAD(P)-dependent oxidoreductase [Alphaproteobacteria bacterium]MDB2584051.1 SDR family NAD(P)-dependent oxidoreductase [Alphaproteobacteria bacterium]